MLIRRPTFGPLKKGSYAQSRTIWKQQDKMMFYSICFCGSACVVEGCASCGKRDSGKGGRCSGNGRSALDWKLARDCSNAAECSCAFRLSSATLDERASSLGQQGQGAPQPVKKNIWNNETTIRVINKTTLAFLLLDATLTTIAESNNENNVKGYSSFKIFL